MIRRKIFGEDHADTATSYENLASVHASQAEYNQAKELYERALMIYSKILSEDDTVLATTNDNLATV